MLLLLIELHCLNILCGQLLPMIFLSEMLPPPDVMAQLDSIADEYENRQSQTTINVGMDPELDQFMEAYHDMLIKYEEELTKPFKEAMAFFKKIENQLSSITKGTIRISPSAESDEKTEEGGSSDKGDCGTGEMEFEEVNQHSQDRELKDRHEEALQVLRNQLRQRGGTGRNCFSEASDLQQKLSIDRSTLYDENKSQRLSLTEITAATATINSSSCLQMHHRSSSGNSCISNSKFGAQGLSVRFQSVDFSIFGSNANALENSPNRVEMSKSIAPDMRKEDRSAQEENKASPKSQSKRQGIGGIFSKKASLKTHNNPKTIAGKEMKNRTDCKDLDRQSVKNGSALGFTSDDESVASSKKKNSVKERKYHSIVKSGPLEPSSLASLFKMEKEVKKQNMTIPLVMAFHL